jgi:SAM-dependent methyltransferase
MHWKIKAVIQNLVDVLPPSLAHPLYYQIQRNFGGFRKRNPQGDFKKSADIIKIINNIGQSIEDKAFLEIGTGRTVDVPMGLWLGGAEKIITIDLHPYLKEELIIESIQWIRHNRTEFDKIFEEVNEMPFFDERLTRLLSCQDDIGSLLKSMHIIYLAPADASRLPLEEGSMDYYFSLNVFEHIPPKVLEAILIESKRVLSENGMFLHFVDLSDHFSHDDKSISAINFLQFSDKHWDKWAGNRFMYHNRLRACEYFALFNKLSMDIVWQEESLDERSLAAIKGGFPLDDRFKSYNPDELARSRLNLAGRFT